MQKILISICSIIVVCAAHADTETIKWYVDGNLYDTTICESGGDINLPANAPTKYGYTFQGWQSYTPVEYIESTGTQYIDVGVKGNGNTTVEIRIQFFTTSDNPISGRIFGARNSTNKKAFAFGTDSGYADMTRLFVNYGNQFFKNINVSDLYSNWHVFEFKKMYLI